MTRRSQLLALLLFAVACVLLWLRRRHEHLRLFFTRKLTSGGAPKPPSGGQQFYAFLSHYKMEAATEARWLQEQLEEAFGGRVFLDSDDLHDLSRLQDHVRESRVLLLLQTKSVLTRPWCVLELLTALENNIPIVGVSITSGAAAYNFAEAHELMTHLDTLLEPDKREAIEALGVDLADAAWRLSSSLPKIISVPLNMCESRSVLSARVSDILLALTT